jgi:hydrogenase maturation factor HypF (carbamoyltransferase family)
MKTSHSTRSPARLAVAVLLSQLLERLDRSAEPVGAAQYRSVVSHLVEELQDLKSDPELGKLLDAFPSAAELYENLNYQFAGLCRSPLEMSLDAEVRARKAIERASRIGAVPPDRG